ncbi:MULTISPECIES: ABC transporter ATP-binding protein [Gordonia]|uniref:ABC transporter ATP-binding protein n=1 Tax=Gordonia amicalis TaxID=89053 RepID=A0AAE4R581_9ACTN|nr:MULTISPECIES: ABC transporter ATP-binding protein [Gordonia]ATD73288.1 ABC transporter ATP-binding protein [Gordonia sp. 1D]MCZ4652593.1 ABC transporter ATP-binding protein [Gordonia amicalis]MDJ0454661.1 ABC transporter ATP-binding protein [Gordonia amicalis]MDV6309352.1 ABC transporter ATP-binding protein [Gordonia amicalis]MDV6313685.1 ABC transporter ATP-binding protein [Gordonia amicalis]
MSESTASDTAVLDGTALLRTGGLSVRYGGVSANSDVDITVGAGEIVGLIGPNGAGKTTFVDAVTGFTKATGTVSLAGERLEKASPHRRRRAGMARTWQAGELFTDLTVSQNLAVAVQPVGLRAMLSDVVNGSRPPAETIDRALDLVGLRDAADQLPGELTLGQQKLVGVARALVGGTRLVLLDEPAAGLDTHESRDFGAELRRIAATGIGILLIDHDMSLVLDVCDRLYVLDFGKVIASGTPAAIQDDPAVISAYLGSPEVDPDVVAELDAADWSGAPSDPATGTQPSPTDAPEENR